MGRNRVPEATTFALEMLRASLAEMPAPFRLDGMWQHMDMQAGSDLVRFVTLRVRIYGVPTGINANCNIYTTEGEWNWGNCTITLDDMPGRSWLFMCRRDGNRMIATEPQADSELEDKIRGLYGSNEPDINGGPPFSYNSAAMQRLREYHKQNPQRAYELAVELGCTDEFTSIKDGANAETN